MSVTQRRRRIATTLVAAAGAAAAIVPTSANAASTTNACRNTASANNSQINVDTSGTASPDPVAPGGTITLSGLQQTASIPGAIFVAGYNLGLLQEGSNTIYGTAQTTIEGTNTVEGSKQTEQAPIVVTTTVNDPDDEPGTGDETATDGSFTANYAPMTFTAGPSGTAEFRQDTLPVPASGAFASTSGSLIIRTRVGGAPPPATNGLPVRFNCSPGTVTPPDPGTVTPIDPATTFASTDIVEPSSDLITGSGTTGNVSKPQAFTIDVPTANTGSLSLTGANKAYNGTVICTSVVGNQALIVSQDAATNRINRASVEDNGASGDKLVNTMLDTTTATANQIAKASSCADGPATGKLATAPAITAGDITINTPV
jgi:hypothetical protein